MKRSYKMFIEDVYEALCKIQKYTKDMSKENFYENELIVDAVIRNLEIIGEASKYVPEDVRTKYSNIAWKRMIGLRNIMIHEYFGVDLDIIWYIVSVNLPETKNAIEELLHNEF